MKRYSFVIVTVIASIVILTPLLFGYNAKSKEIKKLNESIKSKEKQIQALEVLNKSKDKEIDELNSKISKAIKIAYEGEEKIQVNEYYKSLFTILKNSDDEYSMLYTYINNIEDNESYSNSETDLATIVPNNFTLIEKLQYLCDFISINYFESLPIVVEDIRNVDGKNVAYVSVEESEENKDKEPNDMIGTSWATGYFQGTAGAAATIQTLLSILDQPKVNPWIHGVKFSYNGGDNSYGHMEEFFTHIIYGQEKSTSLTVKDFLPKFNSTYRYSGGFENGGFVHSIGDLEENKFQIYEENTGTTGVRVYTVTDDSLICTYVKGEGAENRSYLKDESNISKIILKGPIELGTSWTNGSEISMITNMNFKLNTQNGELDTIEVTTIYGNEMSYGTKTYYARGIGFAKYICDYGQMKIIDKLEEITN